MERIKERVQGAGKAGVYKSLMCVLEQKYTLSGGEPWKED